MVWNQINDPNPSQILGNLNANGYVVLQNQSGFYIGGQAVAFHPHGFDNDHGAPIPMPDLSSGGAWSFNAPPPTASIINYGQINVAGGTPAFLIANNIENHGTISAPQGDIGLYSGKQVLVSERPDGRGLSATVTLPSGSVDNSGNLIADAGTIAMHAQVVNQGGLVQANSVREINGVIELVAGDSLNLSASSVISAKGDAQGISAGGNVTLSSGNQYTDNTGSVINLSGGAQGGDGGQLEISALQINSLRSSITGRAAAGFQCACFFIEPENIVLDSSGDNAPANGMVSPGDPPSAGSTDTLTLNVNSFNDLISRNLLSQITLQAVQDITVNTLWNLPDSQNPIASLTLEAGRNITVVDGAGIQAGQNWSINLAAGPRNLTSKPDPGTDGIYLNGSAFIRTQNGNINLWAANEILVNDGSSGLAVGDNGITTAAGGSITVTAQFGDVNTGGNTSGYLFQNTAPFYNVSAALGGISTAAGGDVIISAGGDVRSYLPTSSNGDPGEDAGTGAFGPEPGNVTINAGGSVFGHYVLANGVGTITAQDNVGGQTLGDNVALSLIKGAWTLNAPNGNIFLQEVRNPDGVYNTTRPPRGSTSANPFHLFDYDPQASVTLNAGIGIEFLTSLANLPRAGGAVPVLFPPSLYINAGSGGVFLDNQLTLFPSAFGELQITTTDGGGLVGSTANGNGTVELLMSDSGSKNFTSASGTGSFSDVDHGPVPLELNNPNPVTVNISGSINNINLVTVKETQITVGGDIVNSSFSGQNLHATDKTTINVGGTIFNSPSFASVILPHSPTFVATRIYRPVGGLFDTLLILGVDSALVLEPLPAADNTRQLVSDYWKSRTLRRWQ